MYIGNSKGLLKKVKKKMDNWYAKEGEKNGSYEKE